MAETALQIDPRDNVLVALTPLAAGTVVHYGHPPASGSCPVTEAIPVKHKLALVDLQPGDLIRMYGMVVGEVVQAIPRGGLLSTRNVRHRADPYTATRQPVSFAAARRIGMERPDVHGLSSRRWPGGHAQLLAGAAAGVLREPQRGAHEGSARRRTRLWQRAQFLSAVCAPAGAASDASGNGHRAEEAAAAAQCGARLSQSRRHSLPHPPGRLRRNAPGCAGAVRIAGRVYSSSQRRRRHGAEPGLPECAGRHADG